MPVTGGPRKKKGDQQRIKKNMGVHEGRKSKLGQKRGAQNMKRWRVEIAEEFKGKKSLEDERKAKRSTPSGCQPLVI